MADANIDRTSAVGLFNTARSYWQSGVSLQARPPENITHPEAPVTFLLCHAIELYLKAFLRGAGRDLNFLKKIGHRVADLADAAGTDGLSIENPYKEILAHIEEDDVALEARYIVTGFKRLPTIEAMAEVAAHLDKLVCGALIERGLPVRHQSFAPPAPAAGEFESDTLRVLVQLFKGEQDDRGKHRMAAVLQIDHGMLQYHLECLQAAGFADIGSANYITGETYWYLTPEGRRYAVSRKLI